MKKRYLTMIISGMLMASFGALAACSDPVAPQDDVYDCLLYTSDAADDMQCVDLGGRRIIKKNFFKQKTAYEISECLVGSEMCIRDRP